jgi:hypothetical protein
MDVNGCESSTTKLIDLGGLLRSIPAGAGAGLSSVEDPLPRVLPTPWNDERGLAGS